VLVKKTKYQTLSSQSPQSFNTVENQIIDKCVCRYASSLDWGGQEFTQRTPQMCFEK